MPHRDSRRGTGGAAGQRTLLMQGGVLRDEAEREHLETRMFDQWGAFASGTGTGPGDGGVRAGAGRGMPGAPTQAGTGP